MEHALIPIMLIHFWWWEFALSRLLTWHFGAFAFVVGYSALLYLACSILFPDDIAEYAGFKEYFLSRRLLSTLTKTIGTESSAPKTTICFERASLTGLSNRYRASTRNTAMTW